MSITDEECPRGWIVPAPLPRKGLLPRHRFFIRAHSKDPFFPHRTVSVRLQYVRGFRQCLISEAWPMPSSYQSAREVGLWFLMKCETKSLPLLAPSL